MTHLRALCVVAFGSLGVAALPALAQGPSEAYVLTSGSTITDECVFCDRAPIVRPLSGSFKLTQIPSLVCCVYEVSELSFSSPEGEYKVDGSGMYSTNHLGEETQQLHLSVTINDAPGVELSSGSVKLAARYPVIEITVTEDGTRDPGHKYTIRLMAAPSRKQIVYELVEGKEGSRLNIQCNVCELLFDTVPLGGSFQLARANEDANPVSLYIVDGIDFRSTAEFPHEPFVITGSGTYEHGGEVAVTQEIRLNLTINDEPDRLLTSERGALPEGVAFPDITIDCAEPPSDSLRYSLHLVARPSEGGGSLPFRRSDANLDGESDISDPVFLLNWLFSGGPTPSCLDAADANADGRNDLADAVFSLIFLFQGGEEPSAPGADTCGLPPQVRLGCEAYGSCDV